MIEQASTYILNCVVESHCQLNVFIARYEGLGFHETVSLPHYVAKTLMWKQIILSGNTYGIAMLTCL